MHVEKLDIALIQMKSGKDKKRNLRRADALLRKAAGQGARVILLPECFIFRGQASPENICREIAETLSGPTVKHFQTVARETKTFLVLGSIYEKIPGCRKCYNTSVFIDGTGKRVGFYRKRRLFSADLKGRRFRESDIFLPGKRPGMFSAGGMTFGSALCYDLRFPDIFQRYARRGCSVLAVPSNFTYETGQDHWEVLLRARAVENKCYVLAPNQYGTDTTGFRAYGNSMAVDPWGKVLARAGSGKQEILKMQIHKAALLKARKKLP